LRRSAYRPSGAEWNLLSESECDRLGALMEAALVHQREGRAREAEEHYRAVLAVAPQTHDALHMLGMTRFGEGDYAEARRLIEKAMSQRPPYAAIRQNLLLVDSAERGRERSALEALCERGLPRLFEILRSPDGRPAERMPAPDADDASIRLIGADDGSDNDDAWMLRRLATLLGPLNPVVWSPARDGVAPASEKDGAPFASAGVHVFVGVDSEIATRPVQAKPRRTLVLAQTAPPSRWLETLRAIADDGTRPLELVVESRAKAEHLGGGHHVLPIPIDLEEFTAAASDVRAGGFDEFVVGNIGQDGREISHARTDSLQQRVAMAGFRLDIYDPGRLRNALGAARNVRCLSRRGLTLAQFLAPLSCYLYRCEAWWKEGLARDLVGAMALGIPVLCPRRSIHAEYVRNGVDGILYDDDAGALEALAVLRKDPKRRLALGAAARESASRTFDPAKLALMYRRLVAGA